MCYARFIVPTARVTCAEAGMAKPSVQKMIGCEKCLKFSPESPAKDICFVGWIYRTANCFLRNILSTTIEMVTPVISTKGNHHKTSSDAVPLCNANIEPKKHMI